ncbi:MAG TPA: hypothetical protein VD906_01950 [Caulobacteraceae bacterium]|nr:hypothetical protein [Caulobacteraceae bacterium]
MLAALISLTRRKMGERMRKRPILWTAASLAFAATLWGVWYGVELRHIQAVCWREGPNAVPESWRGYCERIPPQGVGLKGGVKL